MKMIKMDRPMFAIFNLVIQSLYRLRRAERGMKLIDNILFLVVSRQSDKMLRKSEKLKVLPISCSIKQKWWADTYIQCALDQMPIGFDHTA
jgi:hypothetical protein